MFEFLCYAFSMHEFLSFYLFSFYYFFLYYFTNLKPDITIRPNFRMLENHFHLIVDFFHNQNLKICFPFPFILIGNYLIECFRRESLQILN